MCERERESVCLWVCVGVCGRERERERETECERAVTTAKVTNLA
jgi:hypothetical protein